MESDSERFIREIQELLDQADEEIIPNSPNGALIIGNTGTGKTTLMCLLAQNEIKAINQNGDIVIDLADPNNPMKIAHGGRSCTRNPNKWLNGETTYYDCPGFEDTESIAHEIGNAYYLKKIGLSNQKLKFILVIPYGIDKPSRGSLVANLLIQVSSLIPNTESLFAGLSIVLTKCPRCYQVESFTNFLAKAIVENNKLQPVYKLVEKLAKAPEKFCIFKGPSEDNLTIDFTDRERILACIEQSTFVNTQVKSALSNEAQLKVLKIIHPVQCKVTDMVNVLSEKLLARINDIDMQQLKNFQQDLDFAIYPTIEDFKKLISKLNALLKNESNEAINNLIIKIKFLEDHTDINHRFDIHAWIKPLFKAIHQLQENLRLQKDQKLQEEIEKIKEENKNNAERVEQIKLQLNNVINDNALKSELIRKNSSELSEYNERIKKLEEYQRCVLF